MHLPPGFRYAGVRCGIKQADQRDVTLIAAERPSVAAGVYTQNLVHAPSVAINRSRTPMSDFRALVVNSGNANACTGPQGLQDAEEMTRLAAAAVGAEPRQALVMSTGVIGKLLPMDLVRTGIAEAGRQLAADEASFRNASEGMLTTDQGAKTGSRRLELGGAEVKIAGMAKGAGMIGPRMATMLAAFLTDAALQPADAQQLLKNAVDHSFNCIRVDGHMSTSDSVVLLSSGLSGPPLEGDRLDRFGEELTDLCIEIAKMIPDDGEGASHLITVEVTGAADREGARQIGQTVADSPLVKTAVTGHDPNWGRIVSAAGYAGVDFDPSQVSLLVNDLPLYRDGSPLEFDERAASQSMKAQRETRIQLSVGDGPSQARVWASDLTVEFVRFNSEYHT